MRTETPVIPHELQFHNRWLIWRYEERFGKRTKVPFNSNLPFVFASVTNPRTWSGYRAATISRDLHRAEGVGYVLGNGYAVIDLDNCLGPDGQPTEEADQIVARFGSYTEISPSGRGLHIFVKGELPPGRNRRKGIEAYDRNRYIAMTGNVWCGYSEILEAQEALNAFCAEYLPPVPEVGIDGPELGTGDAADDAVLEQALTATNCEKFQALWDGNWRDDYPSQSEADLALCCLLNFWTKGNIDQIDRLFRRSGLYREKWDRVGSRTIARALALDNNAQYA